MGVVAALPAPALPPPPPPLPAPRPETLTLTLTLTTSTARRSLLSSSSALLLSSVLLAPSSAAAAAATSPPPPPPLRGFVEIPGSGGVRALELRAGSGQTPVDGDQVAIHYYGRLAAKQGWRFDSTYDHKDAMGDAVPFVFVVGSGKVISGIEEAVKSMRVGVSRMIIPPSQGYQNTSQEPIPPNNGFAAVRSVTMRAEDEEERAFPMFFDRQRLFTTIFNPTRLANGEGSTLGTLIFDIELLSVRRP